jgi:hypothetical protein
MHSYQHHPNEILSIVLQYTLYRKVLYEIWKAGAPFDSLDRLIEENSKELYVPITEGEPALDSIEPVKEIDPIAHHRNILIAAQKLVSV